MVSNTAMSELHKTEERLIDLEIKIGFMEDMIDTLNQVVVQQQQHMDVLIKEVMALRDQLDSGSGSPSFRSLRDDLPPHY